MLSKIFSGVEDFLLFLIAPAAAVLAGVAAFYLQGRLPGKLLSFFVFAMFLIGFYPFQVRFERRRVFKSQQPARPSFLLYVLACLFGSVLLTLMAMLLSLRQR
jgi:membrane protease YdiL (CAAX protease family)